MNATLSSAPSLVNSTPGTVLDWAARLWFVVAVIGQWVFFYYIAAFYGPTAVTGDFHAWSRNSELVKGYVAGDTGGNLSFLSHALLAGVIAFGGALQLTPWIRKRVPALHRWNGRLFMVTALGVSVSGLYLTWARGSSPTILGAVAISGDAILVIATVILAWRAAFARDFAAHGRWALRAWLVANGQWVFRVGIFAVVILNHGHIGPFFAAWGFGCYLVPLAVLELYLRARAGGGPATQLAVAAALVVLTALTAVGIVGLYLVAWRPLLPA